MKKITLLLFALLISSIGFSQEVIQNFESAGALGESFGGASGAVVDDPQTGGTRGKVAMLSAVAGGEVFQGVNINLLKNVEVTATQNMTIDIYSTVGTQFTIAPKVLNGVNGAPASTTSITHSGTGWETLTLTFDKGYDGTTTANGVYSLFVIYHNWNPNTNNFISAPSPARTYYVDNISGVAIQPVVDPLPPTAAPSPTNRDPNIISIYNDTGSFTADNVAWNPDYNFGANGGNVDLDNAAGTNNALKMNFSNAGYGEGRNNPLDITNYTHVHFDYYAPAQDAGANGHQVRFILIGQGQGEKNYQLTPAGGDGTLVFDAWQQVDVPLSFFEAKGLTKDKFFQFKLGTESDLNTKLVYFDNIYIYNQATAGVDQVDGTLFKVYPNPAETNWSIEALSSPISFVNVYDITGKLVIEQKVNSTTATIDASALAQGMYIAKISSIDGGVRSIKLTKK
jgi:hypothetical protein